MFLNNSLQKVILNFGNEVRRIRFHTRSPYISLSLSFSPIESLPFPGLRSLLKSWGAADKLGSGKIKRKG